MHSGKMVSWSRFYKYASVFSAALILSACSTNTPVPQVAVSTNYVYPNEPDIAAPPTPELKPVQFGAPNAPNAFVSLDQTDFLNLSFNLTALKAWAMAYQARLDQINQERADWRTKNAATLNTTTMQPIK